MSTPTGPVKQRQIDLEDVKQPLRAICMRLDVGELDLFGSVTSNSFDEASDIDVLVSFEGGSRDLFNRYFTLKERLETLFGRTVDLVMADSVRNPYLQASIEKERINVFRKSDTKTSL
jgi:predicted nucleotidyltransferase